MGDARRRTTFLSCMATFALSAVACSSLSSQVPPDAAQAAEAQAQEQLALDQSGTDEQPSAEESNGGDPTEGGAIGDDSAGDGTDDTGSGDSGSGDDDTGSSNDDATDEPVSAVRTIEPTIIARYPHDASAFTQGLELEGDVLFESLGLRGESARRRVVPTTGEVSASAPLSSELFGAGLTVVDDTIYQLTWQSGVVIVADPTTLLEIDRRSIEGEGWGLCALDPQTLVMSNGTSRLTLLDPATFEAKGSLDVTIDGTPVELLNELECVGDRIWANVWLTADIMAIDAGTGAVVQRVDATSLLPGDLGPEDVLNGIAHDPSTGHFYVTGKRWSVLYEVDLGDP